MFRESLFKSKHLCLTAVDLEKDPAVESQWTLDTDYARWFRKKPLRPLAAFELRKFHESVQKAMAQDASDQYIFAIRLRGDEQMIGFIRIMGIEWVHGVGRLGLAIGNPAYKGKVETEALQLALNYAFRELNLYRLTVEVPECCSEEMALYEVAGFTQEVRQREMFYCDGHFWDWFHYGILREEWQMRLVEVRNG